MEAEEIKAISSEDDLNEIIASGWSIVGPRKDQEKDLRAAKNFFKREIAFLPEHVLKADGFQVVPPSPYTRGHQLMFKDEGDYCSSSRLSPSVGIVLGKSRLIINPGGVGQPRDGNPQASYAIYDSEYKVIKLYRLPYDVKTTQDKMMQRGLPVRLVVRLNHGL